MSPETHVFVIWNKGRRCEGRILDDIRANFEVIYVGEIAFPCKARDAYCRFYGTRRFNVRKKVWKCGRGPFLVVMVKDPSPSHVVDPLGKIVNEKVFLCKGAYRQWAGGTYRIHSSLTTEEYLRDIYRLTGHTAEEWEMGIPSDIHMELPLLESLPPPERRPVIARILKHLGIGKGR